MSGPRIGIIGLGFMGRTHLASYRAAGARVEAQPRTYRMAYLGAGSNAAAAHLLKALFARLEELGYREGRNLVVERGQCAQRCVDTGAQVPLFGTDQRVTTQYIFVMHAREVDGNPVPRSDTRMRRTMALDGANPDLVGAFAARADHADEVVDGQIPARQRAGHHCS